MKNRPVPSSQGDRNATLRTKSRRRRARSAGLLAAARFTGSVLTGPVLTGPVLTALVLTRLFSLGLCDVGVDLVCRPLEARLQVGQLAALVVIADVLQGELVGTAVRAGRRRVAVLVLGDLDEGLEARVLVELR